MLFGSGWFCDEKTGENKSGSDPVSAPFVRGLLE